MAAPEDDALVIALWRRLEPLVRDVVQSVIQERGRDRNGYMTTVEAAEYARLKPATIREWVKTGRLRAQRSDRLLRIKRADLDAAMARGRSSRAGETVEQRARRAAERALARR